MVVVNTGNGKGKSSSAFGMMVRGVARGLERRRRAVHQVGQLEGRRGEDRPPARRRLVCVRRRIHVGLRRSQRRPRPCRRRAGSRRSTSSTPASTSSSILDELTYLVELQLARRAEIVEAITHRPRHVNVIITGRDAAPEIIDIADTVTEMRRGQARVPAGHPGDARHRLLSERMGHLTFLTGRRAQRQEHVRVGARPTRSDRPVTFIATAPPADSDPDMAARIERHRLERAGIERPRLDDDRGAARSRWRAGTAQPARFAIIDCLTLWVSNLMWAGRADERDRAARRGRRGRRRGPDGSGRRRDQRGRPGHPSGPPTRAALPRRARHG